MRKEMYPAIFSSDGDGGYTVSFPDLPGCVTEGNTLAEAVDMAEDMHWDFICIFFEEDKKKNFQFL